MAYRYRKVKYPWCEHTFMWRNEGREGHITFEYRIKTTGEQVEKTNFHNVIRICLF